MKKNRAVYFTMLALTTAAWILTESYNIFILFAILLLLPIVSVVCAAAAVRFISVRQEKPASTMIRGEQLVVKETVENTFISHVPNIRLCMNFSWNNGVKSHEESKIIDIKSMDKIHTSQHFRLNHCGILTISAEDTVVYDMLKLAGFRVKGIMPVKTLVMPVITEPDIYAMYSYNEEISDSKEYSRQRRGDDSSEIFDLRGYTEGDSLNRIHWKLSAKQGELLIKEFSYPVSSSNCILVEIERPLNEEQHYRLDAVFEMAYSIGNLACLKEKKFKLAYFSEDRGELAVFDIVSHDELVEAVQIMVGERGSKGNISLKTFLASDLKDTEKLFYITSNQDEELYDLEELIAGKALIYVIGDADSSGNITKLSHSTLLNVDKDDIRWGLTNTDI